MPTPDNDKELMALIARVVVPRGLRPTSIKDIEALLQNAEEMPLNEDDIARILAKARGQIPVGARKAEQAQEENLSAEEKSQYKELQLLYRNQGDELPPEIKKKLEELRKKARQRKASSETSEPEDK